MKIDGLKPEIVLEPKKLSKKIITPFERLKKRILKEFQKKKFIGDIITNDSEYEILIEYFKVKCRALITSDVHITNDPVFATALVQIGIKYYDGNLWGHVAEVLDVERINGVYQGRIGEAFVKTLSSNNKLMIDKNERVNNILMHGFVSDHYANEMFDFLFKYYNIDLERDLTRNNSEMMNNLIEVTQRNDNTGRTYLLVKQTANAIGANTRGGKIRIRRMLRLIDKCFWEQVIPVNPISRLSILFNNWQENSSEFKLQYNKYHNSSSNSRGKKSYSSPYIKCNFKSTSFKLVLPTQLIKFEFDEDIRWSVNINGKKWTIDTSLYQAVTGYKTEEQEFNIDVNEIFNEFVIELNCNNNRIRLFKIKADCIRFFDKDGDYLNPDSSLPKGEVYAYTNANETPRSDALIESELISKLTRSYFEFEYGDIVRLPDSKPISIGKKLEEGLLRRRALSSAYALYNDTNIPVYSAAPTILLKIAAKKSNGTVIEINGSRYRLFDKETTVIELGDRSGETGYIINLGDYGCKEDGIYTVYVDVPNDRTNRVWQFALINDITYEFEDAPYLFKSKGTIKFNNGLMIRPQQGIAERNTDDNSFNFIIQPEIDNLKFSYDVKDQIIELYFEIPALKWKLGSDVWNVEKPTDIWHGDIPSFIYLKYPEDKIRLSMDELIDFDNSLEEQSVTYTKTKAKGNFECDITRFKSWFGKEKVARNIFIEISKSRVDFIRVITRSVVESHILKGDYNLEKLIGEISIIGKANYFVDIMLLDNKEVLAAKLPVKDGKFELECSLSSGMYRVVVFEDEEDDTGFGVASYVQIAEFQHNLINRYNLEGKNLAIKYIKKGENSIFQMQLSCQYIICNLKLMDKSDRYNYKGKLAIRTTSGKSPIYYDVNVRIIDLEKLQHISLTYFDGYDDLEFLFDTYRRIIVKDEEKGLTRAFRYRRYESLYPEDYIFIIEYTNEMPVFMHANESINDYAKERHQRFEIHENEIAAVKHLEEKKRH
ncbi:MAG: hypothetical protein K0S61_301 [Anaerocolumna sp.]|jgi:hypothetical protein|nr:hypothetical protein [Anaerocolumna sp.]